MTGNFACRECGSRMAVRKGRGRQAHTTPLGILRTKRCSACGHEEATVEIPVRDIPRLLGAFLRTDARN